MIEVRQIDLLTAKAYLKEEKGFSDEKIIAGENSAPSVISLISSCEDEKTKEKIELNKNSNVMLIGCEGDTDQEMYQKLINQ